MSNKLTELAEFVKSEKFSPFIFDKIGALATFLAMVPQGIFAALLVDDYMAENDWNHYERFSVMFAVFLATEEGKRQLVRFFNENDFKNFPHFIADLFKYKNWSLLNLVSAWLTFHISGVFVDLTQVGLEQGSEFAGNYHTDVGDAFADYLGDLRVQFTFMGASLLGNVTSFPGMFRGFTAMTSNLIHAVVEKPDYRQYRHLTVSRMKSVRKQWIKECKNSGVEVANYNLFNKLTGAETTGSTTEELITLFSAPDAAVNLLAVANAMDLQDIMGTESWGSFTGKHAAALVVTTIASTGMYNFRDFGAQMYRKIDLDFMAPIGGWTAYSTMIIMMFVVVYNSILDLWNFISGESPSIRTQEQSTWQLILVTSIATFICTLGGGANTYQSYLAGEDAAMMAFSELASFLTEFAGVMAVTSAYRLFNRRNQPSVQAEIAVHEALLAVESKGEINDKIIDLLPAEAANENTGLMQDTEAATQTPPRYRNWATRTGFFKEASPSPAVQGGAINDAPEEQVDEKPVWRRVLGC